MLDEVEQSNPLLGVLTGLLNLPKQNCPNSTAGPAGRRLSRCRRPPPPSVASPSWPSSRCPASACCCSCGSRSAATIPLKPKGYRITASFSEATQLAQEADVRISGVPVGKVKTIEPDKTDGPLARR